MTASVLKHLQDRFGRLLDDGLRSRLDMPEPTTKLTGMMAYQLGYVDERFNAQPRAGGKRFRPLLCLLACEAVGGEPRAAVNAAAAIELLHNFSLIHDDIEDRDPMRRHRPTVWKLWGEAQGINTGDTMYALASRTIMDCSPDPATALSVARRFQDIAARLTQGQFLDMTFESRLDVEPDEYLDMIAAKTAALIDFSLWAGALLGGAGDGTHEAMSRFGLELGKAFQIQDDIAGMWGSRNETGKEPATDLRNRKKTLPILHALTESRGRGGGPLERFLSGAGGDIEAALAVVDRSGARGRAEDALRTHLSGALHALRNADITPRARAEMQALAEELTAQRPPRS